MFTPKGCTLLTEAVDRLAAGQSNKGGKAVAAARAKLRDELHSEAMLAAVIDPETGKTHTIVSDGWARDEALVWLEQGKCLLTEAPWFDPRLSGLFRNVPTVPIFVSEHDLQRLMAKQEGKQEPAPALGSKERGPKSPPLSGGPLIEPAAVAARPERVEAPKPPEPKKKTSPQWERAERYIKKHYPYDEKLAYSRDLKKHFLHGVGDSITTPAVFDKLAKDRDLKAELAGRQPPSMTLINRMIGRRKMP